MRWDRGFAAWAAGVAAFQAALAGGAPWGSAAWGGRHSGVLPPTLRATSAAAAPAALAVAAAATGRLGGQTVRRRTLAGAAAYCAIGIPANALSRSPAERAVGVPLSVTGLVLATQAYRQVRGGHA
ncbi:MULTISPECIES: hypothetical protein [Barrientosiimonas]|nr:hypothetical protein [Barrientosiimonas endolithica]